MKQHLLMRGIAVLCLTAALTACNPAGGGQNASANIEDAGTNAQTPGSPLNEGSDMRPEANGQSPDINAFLNSALAQGEITEISQGSFRLSLAKDLENGQGQIQAAPGRDDAAESASIHYDDNCRIQIANIDTASGTADYEDANAGALKKSTQVAVAGETADNGEILASRIIILRYQ